MLFHLLWSICLFLFLSFINGGIFSEQRDLLALYLSGTYCHKTGTRPPSCVTPWQPTIYYYIFKYWCVCIEIKKDKKGFSLKTFLWINFVARTFVFAGKCLYQGRACLNFFLCRTFQVFRTCFMFQSFAIIPVRTDFDHGYNKFNINMSRSYEPIYSC